MIAYILITKTMRNNTCKRGKMAFTMDFMTTCKPIKIRNKVIFKENCNKALYLRTSKLKVELVLLLI